MAESLIQSGRKKPFVVLYREVARDNRLTLEARGLFLVMISLPEDWQYTVSGLGKIAGCGKDKIRRILGELEEVGYLVRQQSHGGGGKFAANTYILQDEAPNRCRETPTTVETENAPLSGNTVNGENRQRETPLTGNTDATKERYKQKKDNNITPLPPKGAAKSKRTRRLKSQPDHRPDVFERFWQRYPRHDNRQAAIRAWDALRPDDDLLRKMAQGLAHALSSDLWQRGIGIPYPATWLNNARWEDEYKPAAPAGAPATPPAPETGWD